MFPELNNLLNITLDRVDQVISPAVGKEAGAERVAEESVPRAAHIFRRKDATPVGMRVPGSCSSGRADPELRLNTRTGRRWASGPSRYMCP